MFIGSTRDANVVIREGSRVRLGMMAVALLTFSLSGCLKPKVRTITPADLAKEAAPETAVELRELDVKKANEPTPLTFETDDTLRMLVWGYPELTHTGAVQQNGTVVLPLVGEVAAVGKSASEIRDEVVQRLQEKLDDKPLTLERDDTVRLTVWNHPDLTHVAPVQPDGRITFPLVGSIRAAGRTLDEVRADVTAGLEKYIPAPSVSILPETTIKKTVANPRVSILPEQLRQRVVAVVGEVGAPGLLPIRGDLRVMDALAAAAYTKDAELNSVIVIRGRHGTPQYVSLKLRDFIRAVAPDQNIYVKADDVIIVPRTKIARVRDFVNNFFVNTQPVFNWWIALQSARYARDIFGAQKLLYDRLFEIR